RLRQAVTQGQHGMVDLLCAALPDICATDLHLACALYDLPMVTQILAQDAASAHAAKGVADPMTEAPQGTGHPSLSPLVALAFSRHHLARPDLRGDALLIADLLVTKGADVNDAVPGDHPLSVLYGALSHARHMPLAQWLLDHGANPNDAETLYHATELDDIAGLRMVLAAGADPRGTNALLRAMDFHRHDMVSLLLTHGAQADEAAPAMVPALHHAARCGSNAAMVNLLLDHGADPAQQYEGATAYAFARVFGNAAAADAIKARGAVTPLTPDEALLAQAASGQTTGGPGSTGQFIDPARLPDAYRNIIRTIVHMPGKLDHIKRLVALGLEYDRPDAQGVTPVQAAGWEGLPEVMAYLLSLRPDLGHVNSYGGTLLGAIVHGAEHAPDIGAPARGSDPDDSIKPRGGVSEMRAPETCAPIRDHQTCLEIVLRHGVALPRALLVQIRREDIAACLTDWAERYPGQVV
ncbi:MAG: ankyrin repeat domain-containing protein, partial [Primorskyibacter sp.]